MKLKSISMKLILYVSLTFFSLFVIYNVFTIYSTWQLNKSAEESYVNTVTDKISLEIRDTFQQQLDRLETEAQSVKTHYEQGDLTSKFLIDNKRELLKNADGLYSNSVLFERGIVDVNRASDKKFQDDTGRFVPFFTRTDDKIDETPFGDYLEADWYNVPMDSQKPYISEAYTYEMENGEVLSLVSVVYPIVVDGRSIGYVASDFSLTSMQALVANSTPETGYQFIMSDAGMIVADTKQQYVGKNIKDVSAQSEADRVYTTTKATAGDVFQVQSAINFRQMDTDWSVMTVLPKKTILAPVYQSINYTIMGAVLMLAILMVTMFMIIRKQLRPLARVKSQLGLAAEGDLQATIDRDSVSEDEIGEVAVAYNQMLENTGNVVRNVQQASTTLQGNTSETFRAIQQMADGNSESVDAIHEIAKGASHQSEEMETTLRNMQLLSQAISEIQQLSMMMDARAKESITEAESGLTQIEQLKQSQQQTDVSNGQLSREMQNLVKSMEQVTAIIDSIDSISAQTNLLSLNASIEAARAGEHGKGFAVVAEEVRQLAEQTQGETQRIQGVIDEIRRASDDTMAIAEQTSNLIEAQSEAVQKAEAVFTNQTESAHELEERIDTLMQQLTQMETQKTSVLAEIESVVAISQQSAAAAEEVSANAVQQNEDLQRMKLQLNEVNELSASLLNSVATFKLT